MKRILWDLEGTLPIIKNKKIWLHVIFFWRKRAHMTIDQGINWQELLYWGKIVSVNGSCRCVNTLPSPSSHLTCTFSTQLHMLVNKTWLTYFLVNFPTSATATMTSSTLWSLTSSATCSMHYTSYKTSLFTLFHSLSCCSVMLSATDPDQYRASLLSSEPPREPQNLSGSIIHPSQPVLFHHQALGEE